MRIAIVTETYAPEINGVALTVKSYAEQLCHLGHTVLLTRPTPKTQQLFLHPLMHEQFVKGHPVPRYPGIQFGMPNASAIRDFWKMHKPEAVYIATEGPLGWTALSTARSLGIPVATGFHTRFDDFVAHYGAKFLSPLVFKLLRGFHNRADLTIFPTQELADQLRSKGFNKAVVLSRAVDTKRFHPSRRTEALRRFWGLAPNQLAVIHVGRIAAEKNLGLLARAFAAIQTVRPDAKCIIVGDGPVLPSLKAAHPDWVFCGMQVDLDLAEHFASGDLFLFPSLTETFGNVTLEAMASGVSAVAFEYGAAKAFMVHGRSGALVPRDHDEAFVNEAVALAINPENRQRIALAAFETVQALSPRAVAENLAQLLVSAQIKQEAA